MRAAARRNYRHLLQAAWVREVPVGPVDETLARVGQILREARIPFAVAGGFAVIEHRYERFTTDVDLLVYAADLLRAMSALRDAGFTGDRTPIGARLRDGRTGADGEGRSRDHADVVELLKAGTSAAAVTKYLRRTWPELLPRFRRLAAQARAERAPRPRRGPVRRKGG